MGMARKRGHEKGCLNLSHEFAVVPTPVALKARAWDKPGLTWADQSKVQPNPEDLGAVLLLAGHPGAGVLGIHTLEAVLGGSL